MTRDEASQILEEARPAGPIHADPRVAEALRLAGSDPELARQLARQRALDATLTAAVKSVPVPAGLKDAILAEQKIIRPHFWQDWRKAAVAAAAVVLLFGAGVAVISSERGSFGEFRQELVAENWAGDPHLDYESSDLGKTRRWLARQEAPSEFTLPPAVEAMRLHGARVFESDGCKISLLCLGDGPRHLHLFVLDRAPFSDLPPPGTPDFEKCGIWKTASWRQGGQTYVLTGMNTAAFVSKFRKAGRWSISG